MRIITIFRPIEDISDDFEKEYVPYPTTDDERASELENLVFNELYSEEGNLIHSIEK